MFKSKITTSVMLAAVVGGSLFICISEYLQGSEEWVPWAYVVAFGIVGSVVILIAKLLKRKKSALSMEDAMTIEALVREERRR